MSFTQTVMDFVLAGLLQNILLILQVLEDKHGHPELEEVLENRDDFFATFIAVKCNYK